MRVLLSVASFELEYGGPALSVSRLGAALAEQGASVALWAPDGSAPCSPLTRELKTLELLDGAAEAAIAAWSPDIVHDNGIWLPYNHTIAAITRSQGIPRIVSPRGMLEPWAFRYKTWKKRIAWNLYQRRDINHAGMIHATAAQEADNLERFCLKPPLMIAPNGMDLPRMAPDFLDRRSQAPRTALFLSRVHPKKGLEMLVDAWAELRPEEWRLVIAGPDELGHAAHIASRIKNHGLSDRISLKGPIYGEEKEEIWRQTSLFVLPTHSENFGLVVAEALANEVPVLTTTGAPWASLLTNQCGWWVEPRRESLKPALADALSRSPEDLAKMGLRGRNHICEHYAWGAIASTILENYKTLST